MNNNFLKASVKLTNQKVKFEGKAGTNDPITIDYIPPLGDGEGYTSLELLLLSFASCSGTAILTILRRMKKEISSFSVNANGIRREEHPLSFAKINLEFIIHSKDVEDENINRAIKLSEESLCPVWAMIKNNVEVNTTYKII